MNPQSNYFKEIISKLERLVKREYLFSAFLGAQYSFIVGVSTLTIFSLFEMIWHFHSIVRTVLFFLFLVIFGSIFVYFFLLKILNYFHLFRKTDYFNTANKAGKHFPDIKDDLVNAMQIVSEKNEGKIYSQDLIDASFQNIYNKTRTIKFESIIDFSIAKKRLIYVVFTLLVSSALFIMIPNLREASFRIINFTFE